MLTDGLGVHGGIFADGLGGFVGKIVAAAIDIVRGGRKRLGKYYSWHLEKDWTDAKIDASERYMEQEMALLEKRRQAKEENRAIQVQKTIDELRLEGVARQFDAQVAHEEKEYSDLYAKERKKHLTSYERMAANLRREQEYRTKEDIKFDANRTAKKRLENEKAERLTRAQQKRTKLVNLEKANIAKEKKKKREEEIYQQRVANLKKARAVKKRKRKKKK